MRGVPALAGILLTGAVLAVPALAQEEEQQRVWTSTRVQPEIEVRKEEPDLRQVIKNQEAILKKLDEIMEELQIVKIRATIKR